LDKYQEAAAYLRRQDTKDSGYLKEIAAMIDELRARTLYAEREPTIAQQAILARERERGAIVSQPERHGRDRHEYQMQ
jgi:hypothetical protein